MRRASVCLIVALTSCVPAQIGRRAQPADAIDEFIAAPFWDKERVTPVIQLIREGAIEEAADALVTQAPSADPAHSRLVRELLIGLGRWEDLRVLMAANTSATEVLNVLAKIPPEQYAFYKSRSTARLGSSNANTPTVEVEIGGTKRFFWLDTGSGMTVLGSDVAEQLGILPVTRSKVFVRSATGRLVDAFPAVIPALRVGAVEVRNHHTLIVDTKQLQVESLFGLLKVFRIDGILGWNFIRHVDLEMDTRKKTVTLRKPGNLHRDNRNVLWLGWPYVITRGPSGEEIMLGFDTGSSLSFVTPEYSSITNAAIVGYRETSIQGVGGVASELVGIANSVPIQVGKEKLIFDSISVHPFTLETLLKPSGVLGADILKWGTLRLDWADGKVTLKPYVQPRLILRSTTSE